MSVHDFLALEARYADENRYDEWLGLWAPDACYWVPANLDHYDPDFHVSIIYDDRQRLEDRLARLKSGGAWAQEPASRMRRLVSNIEVSETATGDFRALSNFALGEIRRGRQAVYFAQQEHVLRATADGLRMTTKIVRLVNNDEPLHNLSFIL